MKTKLLLTLFLLVMVYFVGAQSHINDAFFDHVSYRGAFDQSNDWTNGWANWDAQNTNYPSTTVTVEGELTNSTTWTSNNVYLLKGFYYVRDGVTLTIQAGTVIRGDKDTKGTLLIERGAKLIAIGTVASPIVFTSNQGAGNRTYGDWGGVVLCGKATINAPGGTAVIEGGPTSIYGGGTTPDDNDNSGSLKYVRIEFPGVPFVPDKEINGLTLGGVGRSTTLDNIQISFSGDDAFEWFGGTVNAKHLISYRTWDDDFDTDFGFSGMVQYGVALRDNTIADPGSGSNGFESDNDATGSSNTPITNPTFSNVSVFGPKYNMATTTNANFKRALHLRRNTRLDVFNSVFSGYPTGLFLDGTATQANASSGELNIQRCVLSGMGSFFASQVERDFFKSATYGNDTMAQNSQLLYQDPFNLASPNFLLQANSSLRSGSIWGTLGIEKQPSMSNYTLQTYPNPASECLNVELFMEQAQMVTMEVYSLQGRLLKNYPLWKTVAGINNQKVDISDLAKGVYVLKVHCMDQNISKKFIVN